MIHLNVEKVREDFPITRDVVYMNVANHGPPSLPVQNAVRAFLNDWDDLARHGDRRVEEACANFARLIGAEAWEVGCQPNTSMGLTMVAESLELKRGDNLVTNDLENPANLFPWLAQRRRGVELRIVEGVGGAVRLEDVAEAVDDDTRAVSISHVQWLTGARSDLGALAEIAHEHGAYLVVDGIQAAGSVAVDVKRDDIDFYACGSYKWLLGPSGAGFLYVRDELLGSLDPPFFGYRGVMRHDIDGVELKPTAKRLEVGEPSYLSFVGTNAAVEMLLALGPAEIEEKVLELSDMLVDGLLELGVGLVSPVDSERRSGVVSFSAEGLPELRDRLVRDGFVVSLRSAGIRVSTDFYNTEEEVEQLLEYLGKAFQ
jgi:selenocysteine lyase/cysteine desulfurase